MYYGKNSQKRRTCPLHSLPAAGTAFGAGPVAGKGVETGVRVEHIEMGRNNITISTLHALCTLYGTTLHEFFTPSVEPETTDAPEPTDNPEISDDHEQETHPQ